MSNTNMLEQKAEDNLKVAKYAMKKDMFDVAMSRMYYAVFEIIKYYLVTDTIFFKTLNIGEEEFRHRAMPSYLRDYNKYKHVVLQTDDFKNISKIGQLIKDRELADYSNIRQITKARASENIGYVEGIISFMKKNYGKQNGKK